MLEISTYFIAWVPVVKRSTAYKRTYTYIVQGSPTHLTGISSGAAIVPRASSPATAMTSRSVEAYMLIWRPV